MNNLVSILISVYNGEKFICKAINSCLSQTYNNIEVIVYDDGSIDNTLEILHNYYSKNDKIKIINNKTNRGKVFGFNECFNHANGDYFHLLGADDILYPDCIEKCLSYFNEKVDAIFHSVRVVDFSLKDLNCSIYDESILKNSLINVALKRIGVPSGSWLFNRYIALKIFPIPEEIPYEDIWFDINIKAFAREIVGLNENLSAYRQHDNNVYGGVLNTSFGIVKWRLKRDLIYLNYIIKYNPFHFELKYLNKFYKEIDIIKQIANSSSIIKLLLINNIPLRLRLSILMNSNKNLKKLKNILIKIFSKKR